MLTLSALDTMLAISETGLVEELIVTLLAAPQLLAFFEKYPRLKKAIKNDLPRWKDELKSRLNSTLLPKQLEQEVMLFRAVQPLSTAQFSQQIHDITRQLTEVDSAFAAQGLSLLAEAPPVTPALHTLFLQRWRVSLIMQATTLNHQLLAEEQDRLMAELLKRLQLTRQLDPLLSDNDRTSGRLWDMSTSNLATENINQLIQYSEFLNTQPELMRLAEQLGRANAAKSVPKENAPPEMTRVMVREPATVPEQIEGLHQSDDILRLLPPELAALGITELEYEFYRRLLEKQLMTYRLQGDAWREKIVQRPSHQQEMDEQPKGPFIACVDTSGSMGGFNEQCAKAFCLALMRIALREDRRCYVMLFSSEIISYELTAEDGLQQAIRFLSQRFRGGTDLVGCFEEVVKHMQTAHWADADAVIISDFIAQRLPEELINKVSQLQNQHHHRFHAVAMSPHGKPGIMRIFDHIWRFDTGPGTRLARQFKRHF